MALGHGTGIDGDGQAMSRGGRAKNRADGPERRCIVTGESGTRRGLIRFVRDPENRVVPDLAEKLPGRGVWLTSERALVEKAVAKRLFARAFRGPAEVTPDLADRLESLLADRLVAQVALARKAGQAVTGFEKTRERLRAANAPGVLLEAAEGAADGRGKLRRLARGWPVIGLLSARELGLAFGRDFAIHAALDAGGIAERALREAERLAGLRGAGQSGADGPMEQAGQGPGTDCTTDGAEGIRPRAPEDDSDASGPVPGPVRDGG
ncbi:hypothetical protein LNKW23_00860 [Paralimibaculum aggregatum]|uniref:YlxR domain-containing protein n=1 Tax=Paralimibaculum aggregatum TaxID=3036245 RepID=A0ABQ6LFR1_9RHOB|nr:hypothetical protein LNKW23_00860 [Limibaculum sp. NKW23]